MKILGPKEYLEKIEYKKVNEEVFLSDVGWGDSVLGRMFDAAARKFTDIRNVKKIDTLAKQLDGFLAKKAIEKISEESDEVKEVFNSVNYNSIITSLLDFIEKNNIEGIKNLYENNQEDFDSLIKDMDEDLSKYLMEIINYEEVVSNQDSEKEKIQKKIDWNIYGPVIKQNLESLIKLITPSSVALSGVKNVDTNKDIKKSTEVLSDSLDILDYNNYLILNENLTPGTPESKAYTNLKKSIEFLSKDEPKVTKEYLTSILQKDKDFQISLYTEIYDCLYGKRKSTLSELPDLIKEVNSHEKDSVIPKLGMKLARFSKRTLQFEKYPDLYSKLGEIGVSIKNYNQSLNKIMSGLKEPIKESLELFLINEEFVWKKDLNERIKEYLEEKQKTIDPKKIEGKDNLIGNVEYFPIDSIEIVRIFNQASRLFIKQRIPSGRTDGRISNKRAEDWEKIDKSSGDVSGIDDPKRPGAGPFRRISLFEKWNDKVLEIIKKYDNVISKAVIMRGDEIVKTKDKDGQDTNKPDTSALKKFMIESLDNPVLQLRGKAQSDYLTTHLGLNSKDISSLGGESNRKKTDGEVDIVEDSKWIWEGIKSKDIKGKSKGLFKFKVKGQIKFKGDGNPYNFPPDSTKDKNIYFYILNKYKNSDNQFDVVFSDRDDWISNKEYKIEQSGSNKIYFGKMTINNTTINLDDVYNILDVNNNKFNGIDTDFSLRDKSKREVEGDLEIKETKNYFKGKDQFDLSDNQYVKGSKSLRKKLR